MRTVRVVIDMTEEQAEMLVYALDNYRRLCHAPSGFGDLVEIVEDAVNEYEVLRDLGE